MVVLFVFGYDVLNKMLSDLDHRLSQLSQAHFVIFCVVVCVFRLLSILHRLLLVFNCSCPFLIGDNAVVQVLKSMEPCDSLVSAEIVFVILFFAFEWIVFDFEYLKIVLKLFQIQ